MRRFVRGVKRIGVPVLAALSLTASANADMIEVKGRGILNGKVVSQDASTVRFQGADGQTQTFAAKDTQIIDVDSSEGGDPGFVRKNGLAWLWEKIQEFFEYIVRLIERLHKKTDKITEKFIGKMSEPLDRSAAQAKADRLAAALDEASKAVSQVNTMNRNIDRNMKHHLNYTSQEFAEENKDTIHGRTGQNSAYDSSKGRFGTLDPDSN